MVNTASFLRNVPVLSGLSDELLERLSGQVREVTVRAGGWVLREGDPAESLFIIRSGRVEVIHEGPTDVLIRVLRRGDVLGELALLESNGRRSASARASRDVELLELGREQFEQLIQAAPAFALGLTRSMGAQLAANRTPAITASSPQTIAVVGLDIGAATSEMAAALGKALQAHGSVATLKAGDLATIDQAERDRDRVVLQGGTADDAWTSLCLREADLVLALTSGRPDREWMRFAAHLRGCELIVTGPSVGESAIAELAPREVQVVSDAERLPDAIAATARRLAGRSLGVVLSGGGARALAHLGVLEELHSSGITFDRLGGVSLGALVAGSVAAGFSFDAIRETFQNGFVQVNPTSDFVPPAYSLIRGATTRRLLSAAFGERRIEELPLRFFSLSCDLIAREPVLYRTGPVADAIYRSLAIPGVFPPVATPDGRLLVDGGVLDNLPVATMAATGEGPVIAVDVTGRIGEFRAAQRPGVARLERPLRRALTGSEAEIPRLGETIVRTVTVGSTDTVAAAEQHADLLITPRVEAIGLMEWKAFDRVRELGRQAVRDALAADPELPSRL